MQPEARLSRKIIDLWTKNGVWCFKVHGSEYQPAGIPDILGVYQGQFIACETKMPEGKLSEIQKFRISRIRRAGGLVVVARSVVEAHQLTYHLMTGEHALCGEPDAGGCPFSKDTYDER